MERVVVTGPGPMKSQFLEHLPRVWPSLVEPQLVTTTVVGPSGLQQVVGQLKEQCWSSLGVERQRERKNLKGAQRGDGRAKRLDERREREEEERRREMEGEKERKRKEMEKNRGKDKKFGGKGQVQ